MFFQHIRLRLTLLLCDPVSSQCTWSTSVVSVCDKIFCFHCTELFFTFFKHLGFFDFPDTTSFSSMFYPHWLRQKTLTRSFASLPRTHFSPLISVSFQKSTWRKVLFNNFENAIVSIPFMQIGPNCTTSLCSHFTVHSPCFTTRLLTENVMQLTPVNPASTAQKFLVIYWSGKFFSLDHEIVDWYISTSLLLEPF